MKPQEYIVLNLKERKVLTKKNIKSLYFKRQKIEPTEWDITLIGWGSRWTDIEWKNKITEFKIKVKKIDSKITPMTYLEVWDLLEEVLMQK